MVTHWALSEHERGVVPLSWSGVAYFFVILISITRLDSSIGASVSTAAGDHRRPMVIPLHITSHNYSVHRQLDSLRRHLQKSNLSQSPNAFMRLHDNLLINGYYTTRLWIGTPPQEFALIVDSGSTVTYIPCSNCKHCGKHEDPKFQPELSSTYEPVKCHRSCNCDAEQKHCTYDRQYAEMSSSSGVLGEDIISFGNESMLEPQRAVFGCENSETGDIYRQRADGIMGLGRGQYSIVDQLVENGFIENSFSLCFGGSDVGGGAMVLGRIAHPPNMVFSHSDPVRSPYYNIELKGINVAGKPLPLNPGIFDGRHGTIVDSGTTYAYLPRDAFVAFIDAIMRETHSLKRIHGPDPNFEDICFSTAGRDISNLSKVFPKVDLVFSEGQKLSLSPENYLFLHTRTRGAYCLGIFQNADPTTLLGGIIVRNTLVTYDRGNNKIGFWKTNCSQLWRRVQSPGDSAPSPSIYHSGSDGSMEIPPTSAPSPSNVLPVEYRVGFITFDMSFSANGSNIKGNLTELGQIVAKELKVDKSQVHLLNFTSKGGDHVVRWGIFPAAWSDHISNTTALSIILRLQEHAVHFPDRFGNYELVEWNAQPQKKLTRWQQHNKAVGFGIIIAVLLVLSNMVIWLVRRQRVQAPYLPVDAIASAPDQELQPLRT